VNRQFIKKLNMKLTLNSQIRELIKDHYYRTKFKIHHIWENQETLYITIQYKNKLDFIRIFVSTIDNNTYSLCVDKTTNLE